MKKLFYIYFIFPVFLNAQVYKAGSIFPFYYDVVPDSVLTYIYGPAWMPHSEGYYFDINQDSQNDFFLKSFNSSNTLGGGTSYLDITPLNKNSFTRFGRKDSVYCGVCTCNFVNKVEAPLQFQDSINSKFAIWDTVRFVLNAYEYYGPCYPSNNVAINDFISVNDLYVGLKYQDNTDTIYGWIRVNCQNASSIMTCYLKDFSFQSSCHVVPSLSTASSSSMICSLETATLNASGAISYTWSTGQNGASIVVTPTTTTTYTVSGNTSLGCPLNCVITQSVNACIGIREYELNNIKIYPNPANEKLFLQNTNGVKIKKSILISIGGKEIPLKQIGKQEYDVSILPEGLYFLQVQTNEGVLTKKVIIQH